MTVACLRLAAGVARPTKASRRGQVVIRDSAEKPSATGHYNLTT